MFLTWNVSAEILTVTNTDDSGTGSLRRMVELANNGDSIIFDKSLAGKTIELQSDISTSNSISISGKNASVIFSGAKLSGGKIIDNLTFDKSGIQDCSLISDCIFRNCTNSAISSSVDANITNCTFENNSATYNGGAISSEYSSCFVNNCTFKNNIANFKGGAIYNYSMYPRSLNPPISNCIFENNSAGDSGGAIYTGTYATAITDCKFENNNATNGGAIFSSYYSSVTNCTFENNIAGDSGGAFSSSAYYSIINCTFENNSATDGGAISSFYTSPPITNCTFENNNATEYGGAIYGSGFSTNYCTYSNNSANNGGAIYAANPDGISLTGNIFANNKIMPDDILNDVKSGKSLGYNVYTSNQNAVFSESTDYRYTGTESLLVPLGDYGGDTQTMPINTSVSDWETIVRRVPVSSDRTTDQRGFTLPTTGLLCAGSVEMQSGGDFTDLNEIKESVNVYPNPTSDNVHFILDENSEVQLYDVSGKLVKEQSGKIGNNEININDLPQGIYFLKANGKITKIMKN